MVSERSAPQAEPEDEIVERKPSHPVATMLLIVSTIALLVAIFLATKELGQYVNPNTKQLTSEFKEKPVDVDERNAKELADKYGLKTIVGLGTAEQETGQ